MIALFGDIAPNCDWTMRYVPYGLKNLKQIRVMHLQNSAQQTCQSGVSQSMGQWVHEMLKLSESAQLGNQERVFNNPDTLLKSHAVGYSGFISFVYIWLITLLVN